MKKAILLLSLVSISLIQITCSKKLHIEPPLTNRSSNYLALGDSYTIGESVEEAARWPNTLADQLRKSDIDISNPTIIAQTGWTTDELDAAIDSRNPASTYDLVSLLIGVNNQYRGRDVEEFRVQFTQLLRRAIGFAKGDPSQVFVVSIPDWGVTPFADPDRRKKISEEIDQYNLVKKEETLALGVTFIDITDLSRLALNDSALVASDGLHPSGEMYRTWVDRILPVVNKILK